MEKLKINQKLKRIEISAFEIENEIVFNYFNNLPSDERNDKIVRAIYIGVLAMMEDRFSAFLSKTSNHLGVELENLKMIFDMKKEIFYKTAVKGALAEEEVFSFLSEYVVNKNLRDKIYLTGNSAGVIPRNKTGDIVCEVDSLSNIKIVIECKFDKSVKLGSIDTKDVFVRKTDTAWSQLIEAQANRDSNVAIIVFDLALTDNSILRVCENVGYIDSIGFVAIVDSQKGNYTNLAIAYSLARDIAVNSRTLNFDEKMLSVLVSRIIKDLNEISSIKSLVESNIENNKMILKQLEKSFLLMEFNQKYLMKFLKDGNLSKKDLLDFYGADEVRDRYKLIEKEVEESTQ